MALNFQNMRSLSHILKCPQVCILHSKTALEGRGNNLQVSRDIYFERRQELQNYERTFVSLGYALSVDLS